MGESLSKLKLLPERISDFNPFHLSYILYSMSRLNDKHIECASFCEFVYLKLMPPLSKVAIFISGTKLGENESKHLWRHDLTGRCAQWCYAQWVHAITFSMTLGNGGDRKKHTLRHNTALPICLIKGAATWQIW